MAFTLWIMVDDPMDVARLDFDRVPYRLLTSSHAER